MKVSNCPLRLASVFLFFGCSENSEKQYVPNQQTTVLNHDYEEVQDYELMWETMFDVNSSDYYVYIYSTTCNHCEELKNYIIEKALTLGNIYFVKGSSKDQIGYDSNKSKYAENPGDIWILGYPTLLKITGHKCMKNLAGNTQITSELK